MCVFGIGTVLIKLGGLVIKLHYQYFYINIVYLQFVSAHCFDFLAMITSMHTLYSDRCTRQHL